MSSSIWAGPFPIEGVSGWFNFYYSIEIHVLNENGEDPHQPPRSVASDMGLNSLAMTLLRDTRYKWVNTFGSILQDIKYPVF